MPKTRFLSPRTIQYSGNERTTQSEQPTPAFLPLTSSQPPALGSSRLLSSSISPCWALHFVFTSCFMGECSRKGKDETQSSEHYLCRSSQLLSCTSRFHTPGIKNCIFPLQGILTSVLLAVLVCVTSFRSLFHAWRAP